MTKKFQIISDAIEGASAQKIKYQIFEIELGFERATVLIPFDRADEFAATIQADPPRGLRGLTQIAKKFGGTVE